MLIEQRSKKVWPRPTLESIWADTRFALRQMRKAPSFHIAAGTLASLLLSCLLFGLLFGIRPFDLPTLLVAVAILAATTAIAALIPALRIARMDPMKALRAE